MQKVVSEIPSELMDKFNEVFDFIKTQKARIEKNTDTWLTPKEAAAYLKVSVSTLMREIRKEIPSYPDRRNIFFDVNDLDAYRRKRKVIGNQVTDEDLDQFKYRRHKQRVT